MEANVHQVEGHSMIAVKYSKDANSNQDINVDIESIFLCVCPDFLLCVSSFFSGATAGPVPLAKPSGGLHNLYPNRQGLHNLPKTGRY
ncbi:hypothetical protein NP493_702g01024 [Ridgeia piscesae]|uniref:Uncharacterized protein n=1 Tax=Ridgeia piscesae TaxID=27915 RepID=A0AAD9KR91_RIDPI|nr:hypothetical protein NP493_702g01024 [Ridgeia piscesae]